MNNAFLKVLISVLITLYFLESYLSPNPSGILSKKKHVDFYILFIF